MNYDAQEEIHKAFVDYQAEIDAKDARIAELEANEKAYERILGPKSYQELADEIARLREQLHIAHRAIDSANKHGVCRTGTTRGCNWRLAHAEAIRALGTELYTAPPPPELPSQEEIEALLYESHDNFWSNEKTANALLELLKKGK